MRRHRGIGQLVMSDGTVAVEVSYRLMAGWVDGRPIEGSFRPRPGATLPTWAIEPSAALRLMIEDGRYLQIQIIKHWPSFVPHNLGETVTFFGDFVPITPP